MEIKPIETTQDHQIKLIRAETLMDKSELSKDEELELTNLVDVIAIYEDIHYPIEGCCDEMPINNHP